MSQSIDTVTMARRRFPGAPASLDALCRRLISTPSRMKHGAPLDAELLAEVYLELRGGRQPGLSLAAAEAEAYSASDEAEPFDPARSGGAPPRRHAPTAEEIAGPRGVCRDA